MNKEKVYTGKEDFEKKLIIESVASLKKQATKEIYCFSKLQVDSVVKLYKKPLVVKQVDNNIWELSKIEG